ncbi:hypothetical protein AGMMS49928_08620 [Spirochaetia bacterium]|nr:hypothetical protein AGMMS49928_08620 [Spirochaetia bacterium]
MDEQNVLQHLLGVEAQAAALVDEAQAEADRRVAEGEKSCRLQFDESYSRRVEELEAEYVRETARIREDYNHQLEEYRGSLAALKSRADQDRFTALTGEFLGIKDLGRAF